MALLLSLLGALSTIVLVLISIGTLIAAMGMLTIYGLFQLHSKQFSTESVGTAATGMAEVFAAIPEQTQEAQRQEISQFEVLPNPWDESVELPETAATKVTASVPLSLPAQNTTVGVESQEGDTKQDTEALITVEEVQKDILQLARGKGKNGIRSIGRALCQQLSVGKPGNRKSAKALALFIAQHSINRSCWQQALQQLSA